MTGGLVQQREELLPSKSFCKALDFDLLQILRCSKHIEQMTNAQTIAQHFAVQRLQQVLEVLEEVQTNLEEEKACAL